MNNTTWRAEQLITRSRIQAAQARYWIRAGFLIWLGATAVCFFFALRTMEQKRNLVPWVWSSVSPFKTMKWQGGKYEKQDVRAWLNAEVYHGTALEWFIWAALLGFVPVAGAAGAGLCWLQKEEKGEKHIRGAEVVEPGELQRRLSPNADPLRKGASGGLVIGGIQIPTQLERSHFLICGATGSGKTVTIRQMLRQIARKEEPCIVVDPEGEFVREFYDESRGDWLLNPLDARCPTWSPWGEGESEAEIAGVAASLFPVIPGMAEAAAYYHTAARRTFRELLTHARAHEVRYIPRMLEEEVKSKGSKLATKEVISTMQNSLDAFRYLRRGNRDWSAREWSKKRQGWVFLTFRETEKDATLPLVSLWLECLTRRLLSQEIAPAQTTHIVIDELAVLRAQPTLAEIMSRGRKRGVSVVLGFQDVQQLYPIYGKNLTNSILNQPSTRLLLRTNDAETQEWSANNIGRREVLRPVESETVGPESVRDAVSRSHQRREESAVMGAQFGQLPNLTGYLKVAHYGAARVTIPYTGLVARVPAFIPQAEEQREVKRAQPAAVRPL